MIFFFFIILIFLKFFKHSKKKKNTLFFKKFLLSANEQKKCLLSFNLQVFYLKFPSLKKMYLNKNQFDIFGNPIACDNGSPILTTPYKRTRNEIDEESFASPETFYGTSNNKENSTSGKTDFSRSFLKNDSRNPLEDITPVKKAVIERKSGIKIVNFFVFVVLSLNFFY